MSTPEREYMEKPLDPKIEQLLETLRPTPPRDLAAAEQGRMRFLTEMEEAGFGEEATGWYRSIISRLSGRKNHYSDTEELNMQPRRFAFTSLAIIVLAVALLFGGASITAAAAQGAIPGDALYPVKTTIEDTRLSLARDAGDRAQMRMGFAERRLEEITALVQAGRYSEVGLTAQEFEAEINSAIAELAAISAGDPVRAASIASQITAALSRYAQTLTGMAAAAPESVKPDLDRALSTTQRAESLSQSGDAGEITGVLEAIGADTWMIDGKVFVVNAMTEIKGTIQAGDMVKAHLVQDEAGVLTAREIVPAGQEDEGGVNGNANGNDNVNENEIENEIEEGNDNANSNDDGNVNENANDNDDHGGNANANINSNDDDDEGGNTNTSINENENADDDNGGNANENGGNIGPGEGGGDDRSGDRNSGPGGGGGDDHGGGSSDSGGGSGEGNEGGGE